MGQDRGERAQGWAVADDFSGRKNNLGRFEKPSHHRALPCALLYSPFNMSD